MSKAATTLRPGIHLDIAAADYFADPCPSPSFTQSIGKLLIDRSPAHARLAHPRLNPDFDPDDATKYDIGNIAHRLLIGRGKELAVIEADDWRTKAAKEAREQAAAEGKLGVLAKHYETGLAMEKAARTQLIERGHADAFREGHGEVVLVWQEPAGFYCRTMIDWMESLALCWDYKTTSTSAAPQAVSNRLFDGGWDIQAAMHERGLDALDPENRGRRRFRYVLQEAEPPYALTVSEITEAVLTMGRRRLEYAMALWNECLTRNSWPGYPRELLRPEYPSFAETKWLDREVQEAERSGNWGVGELVRPAEVG